MAALTLDELPGLVGQEIGRSPWHTVDQHMIDTFAEATLDHQWIHVDPERAKNGPFGTTIAHGYLTLSLCAALVGESVEISGMAMGINYGLDRVRFPTPVPSGGRVRAVVTVIEVSEIAGGAQSKLGVTIELDGSDKPGCVAEVIYRYYT